MDPTKPFGEACTASGGLKEARDIVWVNDPDDDSAISNSKSADHNVFLFSPCLGRSAPPQRSSAQTTLSAFGVVTQRQNPAEDDAVGGSTNSVSKRPARARKLPAKFNDALTVGAGLPGEGSKTKRSIIVTDDDDQARATQPRKKKARAEKDLDSDSDNVCLSEGRDRSKTRVFSRVPEDTPDTHANTKVSNNLDGSGNASTGETEVSEGRGLSSDDEEGWDYSQMDKMATKDAKVSNVHYHQIALTHLEYADSRKTEAAIKHRRKHASCGSNKHIPGWKTPGQ
jgi:hypothetical protein